MVHTHSKVSLKGVDSATGDLLRPFRVRREHRTGAPIVIPRDDAGSFGNVGGIGTHCGVCNPALPSECVRCMTIVADSTRLLLECRRRLSVRSVSSGERARSSDGLGVSTGVYAVVLGTPPTR